MQEKEKKDPVNRLTTGDWGLMLGTSECPDETCDGKIILVKIGERKIPSCDKCGNSYLPETTDYPSEKTKVTRKQREIAALRSGGSIYPPFIVTYSCKGCKNIDIINLTAKNSYEEENSLPLTLPTGEEGISEVRIAGKLLDAYVSNHINFDCKCGQRRTMYVSFKDVKLEDHSLFAIELGFHNECIICPHSWNHIMGDRDFYDNSFLFRCDKHLDCELIDKEKVEMVSEKNWNTYKESLVEE